MTVRRSSRGGVASGQEEAGESVRMDAGQRAALCATGKGESGQGIPQPDHVKGFVAKRQRLGHRPPFAPVSECHQERYQQGAHRAALATGQQQPRHGLLRLQQTGQGHPFGVGWCGGVGPGMQHV
ncbi:MAG: hypothetical protein H7838_07755 [Magnetococcus sp. DMHC-8]